MKKNTKGLVVAKNLEFTTIPENGSVIIGSEHPGFSSVGYWIPSHVIMPSDGKAYYTRECGAAAMWYPFIAKAENVEVFYLKPNATSDEDPALELEIFTEGESKKFLIDFTQPPTDWYSLGRYNFSGDGCEYIKISKTSPECTSRLTCFKFVIEEAEEVQEEKSILFGTDIHILERLGMFAGVDITKEYLKSAPTRALAEAMALFLNDSDNVSEFSENITEKEWAVTLLTALGYDSGVDYALENIIEFAGQKGIADSKNDKFTVEEMAVMTASALKLKCKDGIPLLQKIILKFDGIEDKDVYGTELSEELKAEREKAKNKKRGIIYNNDGNDVYAPYDNYPGEFDISSLDEKTINKDNFLKTRSYGLEDTQVCSVFYCTGVFNSYTHESSGITDVRVKDWARALKDYTGKDSLTTMVDYVHSLGKDILWSMRMNDTHDFAYEEKELDPWKKAHLDLLMYKKTEGLFMRYGNSRWSSVDFALTPVRQLVYDIFKDTITRYDIDGLELDFTRWAIFFKEVTKGEKIYPENIERMNNLVRMIRYLTNKISIERNKPMLLAIYVPDSIGFCYEVGLDIKTWLEEDLFDVVSLGCHSGHFQPWEDAIGEYKDYNVKVFACVDPLSYDLATKVDHYEIDKQEACLAYKAGADGIYTYNYYDVHHERFKTLGSPKTCGPMDPNYVTQRARYSEEGIYIGGLCKGGEKFMTIKK